MDRLRAIVKDGVDPGTGLVLNFKTQMRARALLESMRTLEDNEFYNKYLRADFPELGKEQKRKNE